MSWMKTLRKSLSRKDKRPANVKGAIFSEQSYPEVRRVNGITRAVRMGARKTEDENGAKKSRKRLRREKDALWLGRVLEKRYVKEAT